MEKQKIKTIIFSFLLGVVLVVLGFTSYQFYKASSLMNTDHETLVQIVDFLNKQIEASKASTK